ncbi:pyridine nucleotide-disulfide oxidoreductase-like protein [Leptodontidium sp. MPI-SDFR-AT-0119]|nr:pyridine nucleotide-disulfide oxidoreductase-like protein [Leptodontidium sp. MPI-SDFR-AT-0119]
MAPKTRSQTSTPSKSSKSPAASSKPTTSLNSQHNQRSNKLLSTSSLLKTHDIIVLSPSRTMSLTPLLASAACGIFDFRVAEEPVRRISMVNAATHHGSDGIKKYQVWVDSVDFNARLLKCRPAEDATGTRRTKDPCMPVPFPIPKIPKETRTRSQHVQHAGVEQHGHFMKSVSDAMSVREKILDCFELASLPHYSTSQKRTLLHFIIVGGGPTGVELAAELDELIHGHLLSIYPECRDLVSVSVYDVADRMLGMFGEKLSEYAMEKFRRDVNVCMGRHIEGFEEGKMIVKGIGEVGFGVAVWAAGNKICGLRGVLGGVYALGDAASIDGNELPATAEVAVQKAK